uniref:Uncharacterized protein n=1 Tax=Cacopsylla melanoneura TaxID=428564 RepID=A0A8D8ST85_9HEMI
MAVARYSRCFAIPRSVSIRIILLIIIKRKEEKEKKKFCFVGNRTQSTSNDSFTFLSNATTSVSLTSLIASLSYQRGPIPISLTSLVIRTLQRAQIFEHVRKRKQIQIDRVVRFEIRVYRSTSSTLSCLLSNLIDSLAF